MPAARCGDCGAYSSGRPAVIIHTPDCSLYPSPEFPHSTDPLDPEYAFNVFAGYLTSAGFRIVDGLAETCYRSPDNRTDVRFNTIDDDDIQIIRWATPSEASRSEFARTWEIRATWTAPLPHLLALATGMDA